ncbi:hypothetical protein [Methanoculleus sp.]|uniref:hypothetical protein n=1 Tax=Methanoculleus sp. TaxID=90427 RepID=UPI0025FF35FE|nr:hypothetical protein [Methanoculleus sp.]MCK9320323.1 hypothetical protein [Methanoculleus sp.]
MIAELDTDGWEGVMFCGAENFTNTDLRRPNRRIQFELHEDCWLEYVNNRKNKWVEK